MKAGVQIQAHQELAVVSQNAFQRRGLLREELSGGSGSKASSFPLADGYHDGVVVVGRIVVAVDVEVVAVIVVVVVVIVVVAVVVVGVGHLKSDDDSS